MVHTLAMQTCVFPSAVAVLQLRHNIAIVGVGKSKVGHKDAPILKEEHGHCTYFDACGRSDPMIIHPACISAGWSGKHLCF